MRIIWIVLCVLLTSCAYNSQTITADNGATVNCKGSVDKPTNVSTDASVPLN